MRGNICELLKRSQAPQSFSPSHVSIYANAKGQVIIVNGEEVINLAEIGGAGIESAEVNEVGHLIITLSTGEAIDAGLVTGADGAPGTTWYAAAGVPSNSLGVDGDFYINTDNADVYQKVTGAWVLVFNIEGPQGDQGDPGPAGVAPARTTVQHTTASLANDASEDFTLNCGKSAFLYKVVTTAAARVRFYTDATRRTADAARAIGTLATAGNGLLAECVTDAGSSPALTCIWSPAAILWNDDGTPAVNIYVSLTNKSGGSAAITLTVTKNPVES